MQHIVTSSLVKTEKKAIVSRTRLISLYYDPPQLELTLDEFEMLSLDRLQLLRALEVLKAKGFPESEYNAKLHELEKKYLLNKKDSSNRLNDVKRDQISHFILRLAYCRTEELRRWFLNQEVALLKHRLDTSTEQEREKFMHENGITFEIVSEGEKEQLKDKLIGLCGITNVSFIQNSFYKVPFIEALQLIGNRSVYLERGKAYVPLGNLVNVVVTRFRMFLSRALVEASNAFDFVGSDTRIGPLLKNMNKQFIGNDFSKSTQSVDKLTPEKVDLAAEHDMPLCMKNLHVNLKKEHKLKHWGRLQYGLFLKGAGLDMEGALQFWEQHFTRLISHDNFVKSYAYTFRHMYGKEGARKNYTPFSCMKIIMGSPPEAGGHHGCPYRHMPDAALATTLGNLKLGTEAVREIVTLAKTSNYQLACQRHFDVTHPDFQSMDLKLGDSVANHPNQWFQASVTYHKVKNGQSIASAAPVAGGVAATASSFHPNPSADGVSTATGEHGASEVAATVMEE